MKKSVENEKVTEAAMTRSIIASVIGIVLCMACLFGTTWAWYSSSVESGANVTEGANVEFDISITKDGEPSSTVSPNNDVYALDGGSYTVTVTKNGNAESGFCQILATKQGKSAGTTYIIEDFSQGNENKVSFTVTGSGTLQFTPMWGSKPTGISYNQVPPNGGIVLTPDSDANADSDAKKVKKVEEEPEPEEPAEEEKLPTEETPQPSETPTGEETEPVEEIPTNEEPKSEEQMEASSETPEESVLPEEESPES